VYWIFESGFIEDKSVPLQKTMRINSTQN